VLVLPVIRFISGVRSASVARRQAQVNQQRWAEDERRRAEEYERNAPERERRARQEAEASKRREDWQRRRESAREACELVFALHRPDIKGRYSRKEMERFFSTYMTDSHDADDVERRGRELQKIIEAHSQAANPNRKKFSVAELSSWYLEE